MAFGLARVEPLARRFDTGRFAAAGAIAAAGFYACLSGGHIPAIRAFVMVAAVLGGRLWHRPSSSQSGLALAALGILMVDPTSLFEASFQLSFGAASVLVILLARAQRIQEPKNLGLWARLLKGLWQLGRASLAATAVTTPIGLWHFGEMSLVAVPVNLVVVPIAGMALVPGFLLCCALVPLWPLGATVLTYLCGELLELMLEGLEILSQYPVAVADPGPWLVTCALASCGAALTLSVRPKGIVALVLTISCGAFALSLNLSRDSPPKGRLVLDVFDVGHGDSMLVSVPGGFKCLVDTGGSHNPEYDTGERIVLPALSALGVSSLDALALSHEDHDHAGGAAAVLRRLKVSRLWHNGAHKPSDAQSSAIFEAANKRVLVEATPDICGSRTLGEAVVSVIHPCDPEYDESSSNDRSLVILVEHQVGRLLLLGDISGEVERQLVRRGRIPKVDVLKVAHHGSRSSSTDELLESASPRYAVVSEPSYDGRVGLHPEVAQRLMAHGVVVLSTRERGATRISMDLQGISVRPL
jgi:competence protein ComEC